MSLPKDNMQGPPVMVKRQGEYAAVKHQSAAHEAYRAIDRQVLA